MEGPIPRFIIRRDVEDLIDSKYASNPPRAIARANAHISTATGRMSLYKTFDLRGPLRTH
jgi:hypothetical protein